MYVLWLYLRSNREKVYLTVKMHIRNKISHPPFVVKMPKLVISLDNEEKQNRSQQQYINK